MDNKRLGNNYDLLRLFSALSVIISHSYDITGAGMHDFLWRHTKYNIFFSDIGVWVFFIISGFLINQSYEHANGILDFIWKRVIRIFPALFMVVFISMFVVGPIVTDLSISEYFMDPTFYYYGITATLLQIYYVLPGVFNQNPLFFVNGSLWTLQYEFAQYLFIGCQCFLKKQNSKKYFLLLLLVLDVLLIYFGGKEIAIPFVWLSVYKLAFLGLFFIIGAIIYSFKLLDFIKKLNTGVVTIVTLISLFYFPQVVFGFLMLPIFVFNIAYFKPEKINFVSRYADVSYGVYIYSFVVQQLLQHYFQCGIFTMIITTSIIAIILGYISWIWVEKPALKYKNLFSGKKLLFP